MADEAPSKTEFLGHSTDEQLSGNAPQRDVLRSVAQECAQESIACGHLLP